MPGTRNVIHQGWVCAKASEGLYEVELIEWFTGGPSDRCLVRVEAMLGEAKESKFGDYDWKFYESDGEMREWYEWGSVKGA